MCVAPSGGLLFSRKTHGHSLEVRFCFLQNGSTSRSTSAPSSTGSTGSSSSTSSTTPNGATKSAESCELGGQYLLFIGVVCVYLVLA